MATGTSTVAELFSGQVHRIGDATAVVHPHGRLSYRQLDDVSTRQARALHRHGVRRGDLVAVYLDNSLDLIVALLAIVKSGASYLPLAVTDPPRRTETLLRAAEPKLVLVHQHGPEWIAELAPMVPMGVETGDNEPPDDPRLGPAPHDAAYIIHTSGSTGRPKGVVIEHGALATYLRWAVTWYPGLAGLVRVHAAPAFDMAVTSLFGPLVAGGTLDVAPLDDPGETHDTPTFLKVTPAHLPLLRSMFPHCAPTSDLVVGGEALTGAMLADWRRENPAATVVNEYGPTEATVGCCVHRVEPGEALAPGPVPIGSATPGTRLYVLDSRLLPVGEGELYIAGPQLARGYLGRPGLTAAAFVADPLGPPGARMYRSGDRVHRRDDDLLEFAGRVDDQLAVNGFRVEPGEIVDMLTQAADVDQAAVVALDDRSTGPGLVAYATPAPGATPDVAALREYLADRLPGHLVPTTIVLLAAFPLTPNGKLDYAALPEPTESTGRQADSSPEPRTPTEHLVCELMAELLELEQVGVDDDFFALGGTSLAAARLVTRARRNGVDFTLTDVLSHRTVRRLLDPPFRPAGR
ncbi:non-ribosomal peptide synthetase [Nocardia sp. CA-107356]|uniref:non-ribosomal peptide synthetase n=1 Tax=Nocardia sp. CA-107356 TaxID=3239972 RepID=UPI003D905C7D